MSSDDYNKGAILIFGGEFHTRRSMFSRAERAYVTLSLLAFGEQPRENVTDPG